MRGVEVTIESSTKGENGNIGRSLKVRLLALCKKGKLMGAVVVEVVVIVVVIGKFSETFVLRFEAKYKSSNALVDSDTNITSESFEESGKFL